MKKVLLFQILGFLLLIFPDLLYSQCDKITTYTTKEAVSTGESFRIEGVHSSGTAVYWDLYQNGTLVKDNLGPYSNISIGYTKSTAGNYRYYFTINNYCSEDDIYVNVYAPTSSGQWNQVRSDSELETNNLGNKIFYINTSKQVCNLWKNGSTWGDGPLNSSAMPAESGRGLVWNPLDDAVYYIGDRDYKIHRLYFTSNGWQEELASQTQYNNVRSVSELVTNTSGGNIFYISSDYRVSALWKSGSTWNNTYDLNSSAPDAATGRGLAWNATLGELYYVDKNGKIGRYYYTSSGWQYSQLCSGQWIDAKSNSEIKVAPWGTNIAYVASDGRMCQFYRIGDTGSNWGNGDFVSSAPNVKDASNFDYANDGLFYVDVNNNIQKIWWDSSTGWYRETVEERQLKATNSVLSLDSKVFFVYDNNDHIYSYSLNTTKSSKITPNNYEIPQYDIDKIDFSIYPNPSNGSFYISGLIEPVKIEVLNVQGSTIYKNEKYIGGKITIANLEKGLLFVKIYGSTGNPITKKLINK